MGVEVTEPGVNLREVNNNDENQSPAEINERIQSGTNSNVTQHLSSQSGNNLTSLLNKFHIFIFLFYFITILQLGSTSSTDGNLDDTANNIPIGRTNPANQEQPGNTTSSSGQERVTEDVPVFNQNDKQIPTNGIMSDEASSPIQSKLS
ncbi:unnamed protein product [Rotaria sordida]|nr:unnamed protein product [Rotaria sordida]